MDGAPDSDIKDTLMQLTWKYEGNKIQYNFNSELDENLRQISWAIENKKFDYVEELMKVSQEKLHTRNKHIRIADSSEGGWDTVKQYEANPLASDSEDESRILKAEGRALRKRKNKKGNTGKSKVSNFSLPGPSSSFNQGQQFTQGQFGFGKMNSFRAYNGQGTGSSSGNGVVGGCCFACGQSGHFRRECPNIYHGTASGGANQK
ncbi:hypothetical protein LOTGIDRAFT_175142 [Lottia gigantea]|uniref:CCHC-type domain-containing protein n=1 Tax=Lottia gigantea TaxID=225164 RepID=V4ALC9_LOTGI|nr:hypothetical protein LOTGIDRAFT_175142 [Lottia gigantea]ESO95565.1 hypothetical protein LOTGIDRAFT_175142 [Lottia gigantea]